MMKKLNDFFDSISPECFPSVLAAVTIIIVGIANHLNIYLFG